MRAFVAMLSAAVLAACATTTNGEADGVSLALGESVTVRLEGGHARVASRQPATEFPPEIFNEMRAIAAGQYGPATGENSVRMSARGAKLPPIRDDMLRFSFVLMPGQSREVLLVIENGYGQALSYHANIAQAGRSTPTDVCTVTPHLRGFEHWPYMIERIDLTGFELIPWSQGARPICRQ